MKNSGTKTYSLQSEVTVMKYSCSREGNMPGTVNPRLWYIYLRFSLQVLYSYVL